LWLLVARTGLLLALAGGYALGARLGTRWAGVVAVIGLLLLQSIVGLALRGASEPLLLACVLWAVERYLAGRRGAAFALGVAAALIRPEAFPFLLAYALWCWRSAETRERCLIVGGLALIPALWLGPPALVGDPFAASTHAANYPGHTGANPAWTALRRGLGLAVAPVWILAIAAVALRPRDRVVRAGALGAAAWLALVAAMTVAGYPGLDRFMLPAAAVACVLAGVGAVELVRRAGSRPATALVAAVALVAAATAFGATRATTLGDQVREATRLARMQRQLTSAIADAGGRDAVLSCGVVATNHTAQTALAWKLRVRLDRVAVQLRAGGLVFRGPWSTELGAPTPVDIPGVRRRTVLARAGVWQVLAFSSLAAPLPQGCHVGRHGPPGAPRRSIIG
jgi:hypothetical protein